MAHPNVSGVVRAFGGTPVAGKIALAMSVGVAAIVALATVSVMSQRAAEHASDRLLVDASAMRSAQTADMMHDAVHGDVLKALVGVDAASVAVDLDDHAALMRQSLTEVSEAQISPEADASVAAVMGASTSHSTSTGPMRWAAWPRR